MKKEQIRSMKKLTKNIIALIPIIGYVLFVYEYMIYNSIEKRILFIIYQSISIAFFVLLILRLIINQ